MRQHGLAPGDFPNIKRFKAALEESDFNEFPAMDTKKLEKLEDALTRRIPDLMRSPLETETASPRVEEERGGWW